MNNVLQPLIIVQISEKQYAVARRESMNGLSYRLITKPISHPWQAMEVISDLISETREPRNYCAITKRVLFSFQEESA